MPYRYHNPVAIHLGPGSLEALPAILAGRRAAVVTFPEAEGLGLGIDAAWDVFIPGFIYTHRHTW